MPISTVPPFVRSVSCELITDFLLTNGWRRDGIGGDGTQYWGRDREYGYFTTAEAVSYEFIRFIQMGRS